MATLNQFRGVFNGTKAQFVADATAKTTADENGLIVFITGDNTEGSSCIYAQGTFFADWKSLIAALAFVKGITIKDAEGVEQNYNAAQGGGYVKFEAADPATVVYVENNGVKIGLSQAFVTKVNNTATQLGTVMSDYLTSADRTALQNLVAETKAEILGNAATDTKDSKTIEGVRKYVDDKTSGIASEGVVNDLSNRVKAIEDDYLVEADKTALQGNIDGVNTRVATLEGTHATDKAALEGAIATEKGRIDGIVADYLKGADKTALEGKISEAKAAAVTESKVSMETPATPDSGYLKTYVFKQNGVEFGRVNLPKDLVVASGAIVLHDGVKCLELTLTSGDIIHIPVSDLVDVYTAGDYITIGADNKISANKEAIIEGLASETFVNGQIESEAERANGYADGKAAAAQAAAEAKASELAGKAKTDAVAEVAETLKGYDTKGEVDTKISNALKPYNTAEQVDAKLADYYKKSETYSKGEVDGLVSPKADKTYVDSTFAKAADTYTKTEVNAMFAWVQL